MNRYRQKTSRCLLLTLVWLSACFCCQPIVADTLPTDLKASLIVVAPGYTAYTAHGHCALRMQCSSEDLDYCFTYGLSDDTQSYLSFFAGKGMGMFSTAYTSQYLADYRHQGRQVVEYELNLNIDEKRSLWALLDSELSDNSRRPYNYLKTNCSSMCVRAIDEALGRERIAYHHLPSALTGTYRDFVRYISRQRPWISLFWLTLLADEGESQGDLADKLSPQLLADAWQTATIVDTLGANRPMLAGSPKILVAGDDGRHTTWFTPTVCFSLLLLLLIALSVMEHRKALPVMRYVDALLLVAHTLLSLGICYMSFFSSLVGASGNLYALVFNPLPAVLWLFFHKRRHHHKLYGAYALVLVCFILTTPLAASVELPQALLCGIFLVRCVSLYLLHPKPLLQHIRK